VVVGVSESAFCLPAGDNYIADGITMITKEDFIEGTYDIWTSGFINGDQSQGKVSYLGGHQYKTLTPILDHPDSQGTRLFLNSLFD
jgi:hypothetical protein